MQVADNATAHGLLTGALDVLVDGIDVGSTNSAGQLVITTVDGGSGTDIVTIPFAATAYGDAAWDSGNNWADANIPSSINADASAAGTNNALGFRIEDRDENDLFIGSVGMSGADINLDNNSIANGQTVTITSLEFRLPDGSA